MLPVVAAQVIVNATGVVWFAVTEAGCVFPPLTVQLDGTPPSVTECVPALTLVNEWVPLAGIDWPAPASTATVYALGCSGPLVTVVTAMVPVVGVHAIVNVAATVSPAVTPTVCGLDPLTVQLVGTSPSVTVWFPALSPTNVTVPEAPIALEVPPAPFTDTVYPDAGGLAGVFVVTDNPPVVGGGAMMLNGSLNLLRGPALASSGYPCPGVSSDRFVNVATPFTGCVFFVPFRVSLPGLSCRVTTTVTVSTPATGFPAESTILTCTGPIGRPACTDRGGVVNARPTGVPWDGGGDPPPDPPSSLSRWQPTASAPSARTQSVFVIIGRACCKCRT